MGIFTKQTADATRRFSQNVRQSRQRKISTAFVVLVKPLDDNIHNVIVNCTTKRNRELGMRFLKEQSYQEQAPSQSTEIMSDPEATYVLKLSGNFRAVSGSYTKSFIFYPKQNNYTCFEVTVVNPTRALIDIFGKKPSSTGKDIEERIISFPIELTGTPVVRAQVHIDVQVFSGFTSNSFLRLVSSHLEDEWTTLAILLGLSVRTVEICRTNDILSDSEKKFRIIEVWRDTCKQKEDFGVNQFALALRTIGRDDLVELIQNEIKTWLDSNIGIKHHFTEFYNWANINRIGLSLVITDTDDPMPVSHQFFMLLINKFPFGKCGTINDIGLQMGLSKLDTEKISKDVQNTNPEYRLLRVIIEAREKTDTIAKTFASLMDLLEMHKMDAAIQWALSTADKWLLTNLKGNYEAPFRQEIMNILRNLERLDKCNATGLQSK